MKLVLASNNEHKLAEVRAVLGPLGFEIQSQSELKVVPIEETGESFLENALQKACYLAKFTNLPVIADDSGLEVAALGGAPGIFSARCAGEGADAKTRRLWLLDQLKGVPLEKRDAIFRCVIVGIFESKVYPLIAEASWRGKIALTEQGLNGFGYDPLFIVPNLGCTAAELAPEVKNRLSHRGKALARLATLIHEEYYD